MSLAERAYHLNAEHLNQQAVHVAHEQQADTERHERQDMVVRALREFQTFAQDAGIKPQMLKRNVRKSSVVGTMTSSITRWEKEEVGTGYIFMPQKIMPNREHTQFGPIVAQGDTLIQCYHTIYSDFTIQDPQPELVRTLLVHPEEVQERLDQAAAVMLRGQTAYDEWIQG
ncbi:MAG TPA: hypothetical protein VHT70_04645 [Candidatus Saccharimonadales bacterium]|jgi:hypothetical protein|nr:hypothetical protein [Candidatus Saccharimonadales bacterium]